MLVQASTPNGFTHYTNLVQKIAKPVFQVHIVLGIGYQCPPFAFRLLKFGLQSSRFVTRFVITLLMRWLLDEQVYSLLNLNFLAEIYTRRVEISLAISIPKLL